MLLPTKISYLTRARLHLRWRVAFEPQAQAWQTANKLHLDYTRRDAAFTFSFLVWLLPALGTRRSTTCPWRGAGRVACQHTQSETTLCGSPDCHRQSSPQRRRGCTRSRSARLGLPRLEPPPRLHQISCCELSTLCRNELQWCCKHKV